MASSQDLLKILLVLTRKLTAEQPLEDSLELVTEAALQMLGGHHASVRLLDETQQELLSGARSGVGTVHRPVSFRPGEGVAGWVVHAGEVALLNDVTRDPRFVAKTGQGFDIHAIIAAPMWSGAKVMGVLAISANHVNAFTLEDVDLMQLLANCAAPAIGKARLQRLAIIDHHTKAFNQRVLFPRIEAAIQDARSSTEPLSVLLMDLDHFKLVNDNFGHAMGDRVLRHFADRVRALVRNSDTLIRRGGEEFVLVMPKTSTKAASGVAERIRTDLCDNPIALQGEQELVQTVSIGVATWSEDEVASSLERRADEAMYYAKRQGRNRVEVASEE